MMVLKQLPAKMIAIQRVYGAESQAGSFFLFVEAILFYFY
jgi:hypothetical protein